MNTKDRILEAAIELFAEKGFSEVSVREITRAVGIKESSMYNHFESKQQILDEIFEFLKRQFDAMTIPEEVVAEIPLRILRPKGFMDLSVQSFQMPTSAIRFLSRYGGYSPLSVSKTSARRDLFNEALHR